MQFLPALSFSAKKESKRKRTKKTTREATSSTSQRALNTVGLVSFTPSPLTGSVEAIPGDSIRQLCSGPFRKLKLQDSSKLFSSAGPFRRFLWLIQIQMPPQIRVSVPGPACVDFIVEFLASCVLSCDEYLRQIVQPQYHQGPHRTALHPGKDRLTDHVQIHQYS